MTGLRARRRSGLSRMRIVLRGSGSCGEVEASWDKAVVMEFLRCVRSREFRVCRPCALFAVPAISFGVSMVDILWATGGVGMRGFRADAVLASGIPLAGSVAVPRGVDR